MSNGLSEKVLAALHMDPADLEQVADADPVPADLRDAYTRYVTSDGFRIAAVSSDGATVADVPALVHRAALGKAFAEQKAAESKAWRAAEKDRWSTCPCCGLVESSTTERPGWSWDKPRVRLCKGCWTACELLHAEALASQKVGKSTRRSLAQAYLAGHGVI